MNSVKIINRIQGGFEKDIGNADSGDGLIGELYKDYSSASSADIRNFERKLEELRRHIHSIRNGDAENVVALDVVQGQTRLRSRFAEAKSTVERGKQHCSRICCWNTAVL